MVMLTALTMKPCPFHGPTATVLVNQLFCELDHIILFTELSLEGVQH